MAKTKLELTWIGKDTRPKLEPRILLAKIPFMQYEPACRIKNLIYKIR